jgi:hypothetical protein
MSDQEPGHGHHALTLHAVHQLFRSLPADSKLLGLNEQEFFTKLDHWQGFADGWFGANAEKGEVRRYPGDTYWPSELAPHAQAKHAVADPWHNAQWNLETIREVLVDNLSSAKAAHARGDSEGEWRHLGAAVHCLQDSFSSAHMFRDPAHPTDPTASIQGINNFSVPHSPTNTHNALFDQVLITDGRLERGSDRAGDGLCVRPKSICATAIWDGAPRGSHCRGPAGV